MPGGWRWDATLFAGSAAYYDRGRLPYAPGFAEALAAALGLDGHGRLLDVGCGPGTVTIPMSRFVAEAVGLDPDAGMLAEARRRAGRAGAGNARWVAARAEDLPAGLGAFRVIVFAQSFHWTDRDRVAAAVAGMLPDGGAFVHVNDVREVPAGAAPLPRPAPPYDRVGDVVRRYLGPVRRAGQGTLIHGTPDREELVLARAGFAGPDRVVVPGGQALTRTADDVVAWMFSRSDSAPHLFGARVADVERDVRAVLRDAAPDGRFAERQPGTEIRIWRAPGGA